MSVPKRTLQNDSDNEADSKTLETDKSKRPKLNESEYKELRNRLKAKKKAFKEIPMFRLYELGLNASLGVPQESRLPILANDVLTLISYAIAGDFSSYYPFRWCKLDKWNSLTHTVVLLIDGMSIEDYESNKSQFPEIERIFEDKVEMVNPASDGLTLAKEFAYIPLSEGSKQRIQSHYSSLQKAFDKGAVFDALHLDSTDTTQEKTPEPQAEENDAEKGEEKVEQETKVEEDAPEETAEVQTPENEATGVSTSNECTKTKLLLSPTQLLTEHYPVPGIDLYKNFKCTKEEYKPVTDSSPMFSLDCEWCICQGGEKGLARVALVDESLTVVYHTFVKPRLPVVDYLTQFSGITKALLKGVTTTPEDVQKMLCQLLPANAIIVGQTVSADLITLKLMHPYIIDTSVIYNLTGHRMRKSKLSLLTQTFLGHTIQMDVSGHNPIEDSIAAMKLVLLKLKNGLSFGDAIMSRDRQWFNPSYQKMLEELPKEDAKTNKKTKTSEVIIDPNASFYTKLFTFVESCNKPSALITEPQYQKTYQPKTSKLPKRLMKRNNKEDPLAGPVQIFTAEDVEKALYIANQNIMDFYMTLIHADRKDTPLETIDKCIGTLYSTLALKGMFIVVFGGRKSESGSFQNGVCMVRVKKPRFTQL